MRIFQRKGNRMYSYREMGRDKGVEGEVRKRIERKEIQRGTVKTKGLLKSHMETSCSRNF